MPVWVLQVTLMESLQNWVKVERYLAKSTSILWAVTRHCHQSLIPSGAKGVGGGVRRREILRFLKRAVPEPQFLHEGKSSASLRR